MPRIVSWPSGRGWMQRPADRISKSSLRASASACASSSQPRGHWRSNEGSHERVLIVHCEPPFSPGNWSQSPASRRRGPAVTAPRTRPRWWRHARCAGSRRRSCRSRLPPPLFATNRDRNGLGHVHDHRLRELVHGVVVDAWVQWARRRAGPCRRWSSASARGRAPSSIARVSVAAS